MDEILGESPFTAPGELGGEVMEAEWSSEAPEYGREAEARLEEWESELGEQPWAGEQERGWSRSGRRGGRGTVPPAAAVDVPLRSAGPVGRFGSVQGSAPALGPVGGLAVDTRACPDVTYRNEPWTRGQPGRHQTAEGTATQQRVAESAAVRVVELGDFDVDDYRLRPAHRAALGAHVAALATALRNGRVVAPVVISVQGRTSSSGTMSHNLALSRNRAVNTVSMIRCLARQAGIEGSVQVRWTPVGESVSQTVSGDNVEGADERQVRVQVIAPRPAGFGATTSAYPGSGSGAVGGVASAGVPRGRLPYGPRPVGIGPGRLGSRAARLCFEVVSVRRSRGFSWLRTTGLGAVSVRIRVHDDRTRSAAMYVLQGVVVGATGSPGLVGRLGPLARLAAVARRILQVASRAPVPTRGCAPTSAVAAGADPMRLLGGPAVLVVPPAGSGRAALRLRPRSARVRLGRRLVPVRARRYPTPLVVVGRLRLVPQARVGGLSLRAGEATEYGELSEYGEYGEWTGEAEYGELGEWAGELGEAEYGELEAGEAEGEYGELGEWTGELGEYGELEYGEAEYSEAEYGESEAGWTSLGEAELAELEGLGEYGEAEGEWGELEGELNEYGELELG